MRVNNILAVTMKYVLLIFTLLLASVHYSKADFQKTKIAVLDFELIGDKFETEGMGAILSEWFITSIVKSGRFDVVERAMLQKILAEQKLHTTGIIDDSSASELGKILGVKVIITGSVLKIGSSIEINSRVISVESGSIIAAESTRSGSDSDLYSSVEQLTDRIMRNFPLTGYIVKKNPDSVLIDLGKASGLFPGTEFVVFREGEVIKHPKTGEVLDVEQILTGRIRITRVRRNVAEGKILDEEMGGIKYGQMVKSVQKLVKHKAGPASYPGKSKAKTERVVETQPAPSPSKPYAKTQRVVQAQPTTPQSRVELKPEKKKIFPMPKSPQVEKKVAKKSTAVKQDGYRAAIFPWSLREEADTFIAVLIDEIKYRINEMDKVELAASYYHIKGVPKAPPPPRGAKLFRSAGTRPVPNLELLHKEADKLKINIAILGKLGIHCPWSDNCYVRYIDFALVDLTTDKIYYESGVSDDIDARDYIETIVSRGFQRFRAATGN